MDPQQLPGQAPDVKPNPQNPNQPTTPYDFIINPAQPAKKPVIATSSLPIRILIVIGGLFIVCIIAAVVLSALGGSKGGLTKDSALSVAQDQTELLHLTSTGSDNAVAQSLKNFTENVTLSVKSQQSALLSYTQSKGIKINDKLLTAKQDAAIDTRLTNATSSSTFDTAYKDVMKTALATYQQDLTAAYNGASSDGQTLLKNDFDASKLLQTQLEQAN